MAYLSKFDPTLNDWRTNTNNTMNTAHTPIDIYSLLDSATKVDTTTGTNGYPRHLRVAYTTDTVSELRDLKDKLEAAGAKVEPVTLHRRDGWALWERGSWSGLNDDEWRPNGEDWTITIHANSDRTEEAYDYIVGEDVVLEGPDHLDRLHRSVKALAAELPDPTELEEGEEVVWVMDDHRRTKWTWRTGQNGYAYDTHQYCTALLVDMPEEEE